MVRILVILLSLAGLLTAFQNCGSGGSLSLSRSSSSSLGFKVAGSCLSAPAVAMCEEQSSTDNSINVATLQAGCLAPSTFSTGACPVNPNLLGVCARVLGSQMQRSYYYSGYSQGMYPVAQESGEAQQDCTGTWEPK